MLIIASCPGSGSAYMSKLLMKQGLDCKHLQIGQAGGCGYTVGPSRYLTEVLGRHPDWKPTFIHQLRSPLRTLSCMSALAVLRPLDTFAYQEIPEIPEEVVKKGGLPFLAQFWFHWNRKLEEWSEWSFCVEDVANPTTRVYASICEAAGVTPDNRLLRSVSTETASIRGRKEYRDVTWEMLMEEDMETGLKIRQLAEAYEYLDETLVTS